MTPVDLRIARLPTVHGEKIVIRILDLNNALMQLSELNFSKENYKKYEQLITQSAGLVLNQQTQIRIQLSTILKAVIPQWLLITKGNSGRCVAAEVLINRIAVKNLIRNEKLLLQGVFFTLAL